MPKDAKISELKQEIEDLRMTVQRLQDQIRQLTGQEVQDADTETPYYEILPENGKYFEQDASWSRLIGLLKTQGEGLTARELADLWGKSRSRTSEVLNRLVERGQLIKYRDGRNIKFRAL